MKILIWSAAVLILLVFAIRYMESSSLFFPMRQMELTPRDIGLDHEEVYFHTKDGKKIHSWYVPGYDAKYTILFSHGNAGNISHRLEKIAIFNGMGLNTFIFDYRGYGKSEGTPSEKGLYYDANAAYEYLVREKNIQPEHIVLYGESLGAAVSVELAATLPAGGLVTEAGFTSVKEMAALAFPVIPHFVFASRFDSLAKVGNINCPKLIIHSVDDEIVPFSQGERLFTAAKEPKTFLKLRGSHNTCFLDSKKEYERGIRDFISILPGE